MARICLALIVTAAGAAAVHQLPKRPAVVSAPRVDRTTRDAPPVASRSFQRRALPTVPPKPVRQRPALTLTADTTMYCATGNRNAAGLWPQLGDVAVADRSIPFGTRVLINGNVYVVRDWIGWGSDFDLYGGSDAGCEQRALNYGRQHLRVVIER
jgi:hypothetical protein